MNRYICLIQYVLLWPGTNYAHYISPSGNIVAYAQFNDTLVKIFNYPNYGDPNDILNDKYPTYRQA